MFPFAQNANANNMWAGNQFGANPNMINPNGYYAPQQPQQPPQVIPTANLLTPEEQKELQHNPVSFQPKLIRDEYLRCLCTHRNEYGIYKIEELPADDVQNDGFGQHCRCSICGAEFHIVPTDIDFNYVVNSIDRVKDIFQTAKLYLTDPPKEFRDFYMVIGFLEKLKEFWPIAKKTADKLFEQFGNSAVSNEDMYGLNILGSIFGGNGMAATIPGFSPYAPNPYYQAIQNPQMIPPHQQPAMGQFNTTQSGIAVPNNQFAATSQPNYGPAPSNPIGYVDNTPDFTQQMRPQQQTATQTVAMPGPAANAGAQQTPAMPAAPQNPNLQTADQQKANVNKNFPM